MASGPWITASAVAVEHAACGAPRAQINSRVVIIWVNPLVRS
jgi:hypothetical protein